MKLLEPVLGQLTMSVDRSGFEPVISVMLAELMQSVEAVTRDVFCVPTEMRDTPATGFLFVGKLPRLRRGVGSDAMCSQIQKRCAQLHYLP